MPVKKSTSPSEPVAPAAPPAPPAPPVPPYLPPQPLTPGDERTWAMLSHLSVLLNLVTGFGGPLAALIIFLVYKDRSRYVAYHALQACIFQLIWWCGGGLLLGLLWGLVGILSAILVGLILIPVACMITPLAVLMPLVSLVYGILGAVQTNQGQDFKYWLVGDWVRGILIGV